jgi:hypothetical protein
MNAPDVSKIAVAWLRAHEAMWSHHELLRLSHEDPLVAWKIIESMVSRADDIETLKMLGVGPIEDLLSNNGEAVIAEVEHFAEREPKFIDALEAAWKSTIPDEVWAKVQALLRKAGRAA